MNYKAILQYDGTRYRGWQVQGNTDNTIQGKIETLLTRMAGEPVEVNGSGRTDAGVHAAGQVISFRCQTDRTPEDICAYMNQYLPEDICVLSVEEAAPRFHARLNAVRKTYVYRIWNAPVRPVFERKYVTWIEQPLDVDAMRRAAELLCGTHDYRAFCSLKKFKKSTVRTVYYYEVERQGNLISLRVCANGFLYNMARAMAGTVVYAAEGKLRPEDIGAILARGDRTAAGPTVPPGGLYMTKLWYEDGEVSFHVGE